MGPECFAQLDAMGLAYIPVWKTYSECRSIFIRTQCHQGIRIKRVPNDHQQLLSFCECAKNRGIKLDYFGESAGVLCHKFMQRLLVCPRHVLDAATCNQLQMRQHNRCNLCGDLLKRYEVHHKQAISHGGSDSLNNLSLLCPQCHASETEKQESAGNRSCILLESRLSPSLYKTFVETPTPRQIVWGDNERQARVCMEDVSCMDVVGCRLNAFMERLRPFPIGCPMDELEPIGDRHLSDFEWLWVDVYGDVEEVGKALPIYICSITGRTCTPWKPCSI